MKQSAIWGACLAIVIFSCKKEEDVKEDIKQTNEVLETITSAEDHSQMEGNVYASYDIADDLNRTTEYDSAGGVANRNKALWFPAKAQIVWIDSTFRDGNGIEYIIDFGQLGSAVPKGMLCRDGRYRAGKIHVSLSDRYRNTGAVVRLWINDADQYYAGDGTNMTQFSKTHTWTRTGEDIWTVAVRDAKSVSDKGTVTWKSDRELKRIAGGTTPSFLDDEYEITGSADGVNREGKGFTASIESPLKKKIQAGCASTFVKGVIKIQNDQSSQAITLDYDPYEDGACDKFAKVKVGDKEQIITVR
jgi:hypothetical protein